MLNFLDGQPFARGRAKYSDQDIDAPEGSAKVFVRIEPSGLLGPVLAQLDTAASWSILNVEIAQELNLLNGPGQQVTLSTRLGSYTGRLESAVITILAEEGVSLDVDATVFVSPEWPGPTFIGYMGLLERIRFALNPQQNDFYFGGD